MTWTEFLGAAVLAGLLLLAAEFSQLIIRRRRARKGISRKKRAVTVDELIDAVPKARVVPIAPKIGGMKVGATGYVSYLSAYKGYVYVSSQQSVEQEPDEVHNIRIVRTDEGVAVYTDSDVTVFATPFLLSGYLRVTMMQGPVGL